LTLRSTRVVLPEIERAASIQIENGIITSIDDLPVHPGQADRNEILDVGDLVVSPGIVDTHVHVNEPGRTEWEGFDTATRAAAAGGVTTIVDMPLNSIPATTTVAALEAKRRAAAGLCRVDVGFWGGVVPGNADQLEPLVAAGVRGFKCFLVPSGVDEFPAVGENDLRRAMPILSRLSVPLLVHAESPAFIRPPEGGSRVDRYDVYLATRPPEAEVDAIRMMVGLSKEFGTRIHIVHVASADAAIEIGRAKADGVSITAETCPHYLTFAADEIQDGATEFKCAPPIRESTHRTLLWNALQRGALDMVATDHSPAPPALKCPGDFIRAWGGIASLELSLSATWTAAAGQSGVDHCVLARWMSDQPAKLAGLDRRKGRIAVGHDADLVIWNPAAPHTVDASRLQQRHKLTPYAGRRLLGRVVTTFLRGRRVWDANDVCGDAAGCFL